MEGCFSPAETLKIAVNVEKNGKIFYQNREGFSSDEKAKKVWRYLKEQEVEHEKIFQDMLDGIDDYAVSDLSDGLYEEYFRAISREYVFTVDRISNALEKGFESEIEAIDFAISIEKESILVYSSLKRCLSSEKYPVIDRIIEEEQRHFTDLVNLKYLLEHKQEKL